MTAIKILVNGEEAAEVSVADRGFQYGDGVFETFKLTDGKPEFWARHIARLEEGCKRLNFPAPSISVLRGDVDALRVGPASGVLKIMVTRGVGGRGYKAPDPACPTRVTALYPFPEYPESYYSEGVKIRTCATRLADQPRLAGIKHMNRLEQILARSEWKDDDIAEGLMTDANGNVIEGTMANLFAVKDGALSTPDLSRCGVSGIMRAVVLDLARKAEIEPQIRDIPMSEVEDADELFLTNSVIGIWPVKSLDARDYKPGDVTAKLTEALANHARN